MYFVYFTFFSTYCTYSNKYFIRYFRNSCNVFNYGNLLRFSASVNSFHKKNWLYLTFSYLLVEKLLFLGRIFKMEISMDLYVLRSLESENHIFSVWSVCVCLCVSVISITHKQITAESSDLAFYFCVIGRCYFKLFIKIGQKLCVQGHAKEF